eukprot:10016_1
MHRLGKIIGLGSGSSKSRSNSNSNSSSRSTSSSPKGDRSGRAGTMPHNTSRTIREVESGRSLTIHGTGAAVTLYGDESSNNLFETQCLTMFCQVCPVFGRHGSGFVNDEREMKSKSKFYVLEAGVRNVEAPMKYFDQAHHVQGDLPKDSKIFIDAPITMNTDALNSSRDIQLDVKIPGETGRKSVWLSAAKLLKYSLVDPSAQQSTSASLSNQLGATTIGGTNYVFY